MIYERHDGSLEKRLLEGNPECVIHRRLRCTRQRAIMENVAAHVHRCVARLRVGITDSRRECDKYNGETELALIRSASKTSPPYAVIIPVTRYSVDE